MSLDEKIISFVLSALVIGSAAIAWVTIDSYAAAKKEFMAECLTEHKQYECAALWRSGRSASTILISPIRVR